jgi:hypothetical protein
MSSAAPYELAFQLHGHASDVRTLCAPSPDIPLLLSGSRDGSALLWGPGKGKEWDVKLRVEAPEKKYVSCVGMTRWQGEGESVFEVPLNCCIRHGADSHSVPPSRIVFWYPILIYPSFRYLESTTWRSDARPIPYID